MALNSLFCADVPLSNYSLTHSQTSDMRHMVNDVSALSGIARFIKLWILFVDDLLDRYLCKISLISIFFLIFNYDCITYGPLDQAVRRHVLRLGCSRPEHRPRGCRAGRHVQAIRSTDVRRRLSSPCRTTLRTISCRVSSPIKVGLFNAWSVVSSGKSQSISTWVSKLKLTAAGLVETWHDGPDTPALVAWLRVCSAITVETWWRGGY